MTKHENTASLEVPFRNWLLQAEDMASSTTGAYITALKLSCEKLEGINVAPSNILQYHTLAEVTELHKRVRTAPNFNEVNSNASSGSFEAGFKKYEKFLGLIDSNNFPDSLQALSLSIQDLFHIWLAVTTGWVENTVVFSIRTLENRASLVEGFANFNPNLFLITDPEKFESIENNLRAAPNFKQVDERAYNHSFSRGLRKYKEFLQIMNGILPESNTQNPDEDDSEVAQVVSPQANIEKYGLIDIKNEGCFLDLRQLEIILGLLKDKKNIILQGPPGTGKTWLAKRLGYALMGEKDPKSERMRALQFHATLSYEDFVRGWRPSGEGKLTLCDGPFLEMVDKAQRAYEEAQEQGGPLREYVVVIEEINRGNPAQIFGELLTLLESDKRCEEEALHLSYRSDEKDEPVHIPKNLFVIGTMNIADRSLAMVDFALRRRFAFITLKPVFGDEWKKWMMRKDKADLPSAFVDAVSQKITALNKTIAEDGALGEQYAIGHSYFTSDAKIASPLEWYKSIVETQIKPLLYEYWIDDSNTVDAKISDLLQGMS